MDGGREETEKKNKSQCHSSKPIKKLGKSVPNRPKIEEKLKT